MNAYSGNEPYVFFSYAHADLEHAQALIVGLKQKLCRVWYDEGLTPGEHWNDDLAEHLLRAAIVVVLVSPGAAKSQYVRMEVTYAIAKGIALLPVMMERAELPPGLEMQLSGIQFLDLAGIEGIEAQVTALAARLPDAVFQPRKVPFLEADGFSFYLETDTMVNGASSAEKHADRFSILCCRGDSQAALPIFDFAGSMAYDIDYTVTQCRTIVDDYFVGSIRGVHIVNVLADCRLDYPLSGPDFQLLLILALRVPENDLPVARLIDYQYVYIRGDKRLDYQEITSTSWGREMDRTCWAKLCTAGAE